MSTSKNITAPPVSALTTLLHKDGRYGEHGWNGWLLNLRLGLAGPRKSLRAYMMGHDVVDTLQVSFKGGKAVSAFVPGCREVDASVATYVLLDGSRRDYAGITCMGCANGTWIGWVESMTTIVMYRSI